MDRQGKRILTTHVGSLPRSSRLDALMGGTRGNEANLQAAIKDAVRAVVDQQEQIGFDIIDDGEQSKSGFVSYLNDRLSGFEAVPQSSGSKPWAGTREALAFPEFYQSANTLPPRKACVRPIGYIGHDQLSTDLDNLKVAVLGRRFEAVFVPSAAPASVEGWQSNKYYKTPEEYLFAIADAMREEYLAIVNAGFQLQIDDPWLAMHYTLFPHASIDECRRWARVRVEALNYALRGIPPEMIRHHTCYGINMGPRVFDLEMKHLIDIVLAINADGYSFEFANPRHEHEWTLWEDANLPEHKYVMPGFVTHTSVLVEHPEYVAQNIERFVNVLGAHRVVASSDCGFATNPSAKPEVHPTIVWAKFKSLIEGARLVSEKLKRG